MTEWEEYGILNSIKRIEQESINQTTIALKSEGTCGQGSSSSDGESVSTIQLIATILIGFAIFVISCIPSSIQRFVFELVSNSDIPKITDDSDFIGDFLNDIERFLNNNPIIAVGIFVALKIILVFVVLFVLKIARNRKGIQQKQITANPYAPPQEFSGKNK